MFSTLLLISSAIVTLIGILVTLISPYTSHPKHNNPVFNFGIGFSIGGFISLCFGIFLLVRGI